MRDLRVFIQTMITLASASLGLVAALAWNEAIKATIKKALGDADGLSGLYIYAIAATVLSRLAPNPHFPLHLPLACAIHSREAADWARQWFRRVAPAPAHDRAG